jgi:thymidylate synthase
MKQYLDLLRHVLEHGAEKSDRTGTGTRSVFGWQMRFDLNEGFPLVTTKKLHLALDHPRAALVPEGRDQHRLPEGQQGQHLGRVGRRERRTRAPCTASSGASGKPPTADGRPDAVAGRRDQAQSRFASPGVSAWNVAELPKMALMPCHSLFQFYVVDGKAELPAVPAQRRHLPRCAVQHRQLRTADASGGAGHGIWAWAISCIRWATRICTPTTTNRRASSCRANRARCPRCTSIPRCTDLFAFTFDDIGIHGYEPHPGDQGAGGGLADAHFAGRRTRPPARHRARQRPAVAVAGRPEALQGADARQADADGAQDRRVARACACRARESGADATAMRAVRGHAGVASVDEAVLPSRLRRREELCVIGGGEVYALTLGRADVLHLTEVDTEVEGAACVLPGLRSGGMARSRPRTAHPADAKHAIGFDFVEYRRV